MVIELMEFGTGVYVSVLTALAATLIVAPAVCAVEPSLSVPVAGTTRDTLWMAFAGLSLPSLNPKLACWNVYTVSSNVVTGAVVPLGGSLIDVTLMVNVLGD